MPKYLDPKADLTFKKVFGQHPNLVMSLLNALLPLPDGMEIRSVEYLTAENIPNNPAKKYSIVDVKCTDNYNRHFIVEMQSYWTQEFFSRTVFNAAAVYANQLGKGVSFQELKDVNRTNRKSHKTLARRNRKVVAGCIIHIIITISPASLLTLQIWKRQACPNARASTRHRRGRSGICFRCRRQPQSRAY